VRAKRGQRQKKKRRKGCRQPRRLATITPLMADQNKEQLQTATQILVNAASQARLTAAEHEQVRQATQIVATELGLTGPPDSPQPDIVMPEPVVEEKAE
jgi:hypothetical protein